MPPVRARSLTGWQPDKKRLFKPRLQTLIAPGHSEMCEAPGRANLGQLRPIPTFAFPADMLLHPVDGNKTGKVILELDVYYAISLPIKFRIFDRGVL